MRLEKETLKAAAVALLDSLAEEHPLGHQPRKARRYVLRAPGGTPLEVMFEQDPDSSANLWVHAKAAGPLAASGKRMSAASLRSRMGTDGKPLYGRHSALEKMPQLGESDLIRFPLTSLAELGTVLDRLWSASAGRLAT